MTLLARELMGHATLENFSFSDYTYDTTATLDILIHALTTIPNLSSLHLSPCGDGFSQPMFSAHFFHLLLPCLEKLHWEHFLLEEATDCSAFAESLQKSHLKTLELEYCDVDHTPQIFDALQTCIHLRNLRLKHVYLSEGSFRAIGKLLEKTTGLEIVNLVECLPMWEDRSEIRHLFPGLGMNTTLREFAWINRNQFAFDDPNSEVFGSLCQSLMQNSSLHTVKLICCYLKDEHAPGLASIVRNNVSLKELDLSLNELTPVGLSSFLPALHENAILEDLNLHQYSTPDGNDRTISFVAGLPKLSSLKKLSLPYECLNEQHWDSFLQAVRQNYGLEYLNVQTQNGDINNIVQTILSLNKAGRRYLLEDGAPRTKGVQVLINVVHDLDCLFFHLLENPGLCDISTPNESSPKKRKHSALER